MTNDKHLASTLPAAEVLRHVVDVHCHPTEIDIRPSDVDRLDIMRICAMASRRSDQHLVAELARSRPDKVTPAFGYHPWFSHLISLDTVLDTPDAREAHYRSLLIPVPDGSKDTNDAFQRVLQGLPHPFPLPELITMIRGYFSEFLGAHQSDSSKPKPMLGEVGLDRSYRVPFSVHQESEPLDPDDDGPKLSPFFTPIEHQQAILEAQLNLAVDLGINVSLHSVKAPAQTIAVLKRLLEQRGPQFDAISIDLHSCGMSASTLRDIQSRHPNVYISLSTAINMRSESRMRELIKVCAADKILTESDVVRVDECTPRTWAMVLHIADVKGWVVEKEWNIDLDGSTGAVHQLELNWRSFEKAGYVRKEKRKSRKKADYP